MIIIADSNIIFSALTSPTGSVAFVFKERSNFQFIAPDFMEIEIYKHWNKIMELSPLSAQKLIKEFDFYKTKITFISVDKIPKKYKTKASEIVKNIDIDDGSFVALHLYQKHKIWTGDKKLIKGLKEKGYDICITTSELKEKLYKKRRRSGALPLLAVLLAMLLV